MLARRKARLFADNHAAVVAPYAHLDSIQQQDGRWVKVLARYDQFSAA
jgi:hypothetical protein